jgi:diaminopimelate epimerase
MVRPDLVGLPIYKMTGSGNDFVMVDGRLSQPGEWQQEEMRELCARGTGVGADGLVFVSPGAEPGAARMVYYNSDGSHAAMCGNAALCSTRLAVQLGLVRGPALRLETDAGVYEARYPGQGDRAELRLAAVAPPSDVPGLATADTEKKAALAVVGVPHLVILMDDVDQVDVAVRGKALRFDPAVGTAGANVNFISKSNGGWHMRTYERGVEAETLACGTGSVAAACALDRWGVSKLPATIYTRSGRTLDVRAKRAKDGRYDDVWLAGEARVVFRGVLT